ncbi:MAG: DNA translocase FtsK 4TM domain-containing protein [Giesbergeria sp.]|nr:DNA translocase FtsK 4TM domain-containing protein [Giesbergeria sp.]MBP7915856.1 DNA translocase FtsK 4TM domain-containing protein [Giesbergeria sp.]
MTYTFNTLNVSADAEAAPRSGIARFGHEVALVLGLLALIYWSLALISYVPLDPAWSTSGASSVTEVANWGGSLGAWLADSSYFVFGFSAWWCVAAGLGAWLGSLARWMRSSRPSVPETLLAVWRRRLFFWCGLALMLSASTALEWSRMYRFEGRLPDHAGGMLGYELGPLAMHWLGFTGSGLLSFALLVLGAALVFRFSWSRVAEALGRSIDALVQLFLYRREAAQDSALGKRAALQREGAVQEERSESEALHPQPLRIIEPVLVDTPLVPQDALSSVAVASASAPLTVHKKDSASLAKQRLAAGFNPRLENVLPPLALLDSPAPALDSVAAETLEMTSRMIEKKLKDFGVEVRVVAAMPGPVITRYDVEPAAGAKASQIVGLAKDLARALSLASIRVIEPLDGKKTMALELPNAKRQAIRLSEVLGSQAYRGSDSLLTLGLGKDIVGNPVVVDLAKMPHLLVAGTTGSGKSVGINAMLLSLLYKAEAKDVRLLMIDPKMLELAVYDGIAHLLAPVIRDMKQATHSLNWCVAEMERRYHLMAELGVRNMAGYNAKIDALAASAAQELPKSEEGAPAPTVRLERLPYIVVVVDELADLMLSSGKRMEELIARLAQKARAAGIHFILATQRPHPEVITGLIKANIPTRIAYQVSARMDSRTILDQMGAEALLGQGDMLYLASGAELPQRVHGALVSDEEVARVVAYLKSQGKPQYIPGILDGSAIAASQSAAADGGVDPMYRQAVELVLADGNSANAHLQRQLRIGYTQAEQLLQEMEKDGILSPPDASGLRQLQSPEHYNPSRSQRVSDL